MAASKKTDGQKILEARDGPKVERDDLATFYAARAHEKGQRSSDASESADKTKKFLDETALNASALKWGSSIIATLDKKDGQHKAMDQIRSLKFMLPLLEALVVGNGNLEMDLPDPDGEAAPEPAGEETPDDSGDEASVPEELAEIIKDGDPELAADAEDFEKDVKSATVTPLKFAKKS